MKIDIMWELLWIEVEVNLRRLGVGKSRWIRKEDG